jgi:hypothetical protein
MEEAYEKLQNAKFDEVVELHVRSSDLTEKRLKIPAHSVRIKLIIHNILTIDLEIDPNNKDVLDDKYALFSTDNEKTYYKELTVRDDKVNGDNRITLEYDEIRDGLNYSLKIDLGQGKSYFLFENMAYLEMKKLMRWL